MSASVGVCISRVGSNTHTEVSTPCSSQRSFALSPLPLSHCLQPFNFRCDVVFVVVFYFYFRLKRFFCISQLQARLPSPPFPPADGVFMLARSGAARELTSISSLHPFSLVHCGSGFISLHVFFPTTSNSF